jgi:hypothetical protein
MLAIVVIGRERVGELSQRHGSPYMSGVLT